MTNLLTAAFIAIQWDFEPCYPTNDFLVQSIDLTNWFVYDAKPVLEKDKTGKKIYVIRDIPKTNAVQYYKAGRVPHGWPIPTGKVDLIERW